MEKVQHLFGDERVGNALHHGFVEPTGDERRSNVPGVLDAVRFQPVTEVVLQIAASQRAQVVAVQRHGLVKRRERVAVIFLWARLKNIGS